MPLSQHPPVLKSLNKAQLRSVLNYMDRLRRGNEAVALQESERLALYLNALAVQLKMDLMNLPDTAEGKAERQRLEGLSQGKNLCRLFNAVARDTRSSILSEIVIAPESLLQQEDIIKDTVQFGAPENYDGHSYTLGFIQAFEKGKKAAISFPVLLLDDKIMAEIKSFRPAHMFQALQVMMTAGNHDVLHHFTNRILNTSIVQVSGVAKVKPEFQVGDWHDRYFTSGDTQPESYESWLMLNHARIRRAMEEGPEGEVLKKAVDRFFDELDRIGREMTMVVSEEAAHTAVDYLGTMFCFTMMRFMPLDHSLFEKAVARLQQADPKNDTLLSRRQEIVEKINRNYFTNNYLSDTVKNYQAQGVTLLPENPDYFSLKRLQMMLVSPWTAHLMSPARPNTLLATMQDRVDQVNRAMLTASASNAWFEPVDGKHTYKTKNGKVTAWYKDGQLHCDEGPAFVETAPDGDTHKLWFKNGQLEYEELVSVLNGCAEKKWYKDGVLHRDGGPAYIRTDAEGSSMEIWFKKGKKHRQDGPAVSSVNAEGTHTEEWCQNGVPYRADSGPTSVCTDMQGTYKEERWEDRNGNEHRTNGPAYIRIANGSVTEKWYKHGKRHRDGGLPASISVDADGVCSQEWYRSGKIRCGDGPGYIKTAADGTRILECWYKQGAYQAMYHRDGAPAVIEIAADGTRTEKWYKDGERIEAPEVLLKTTVKSAKIKHTNPKTG